MGWKVKPRTEEQCIYDFWEKVDKSGGPDACWPYTGCTFVTGYGQVNFLGEKRSAHRLVMELCGHDITGAVVMHLCDNRICVNPAHLRVGTHADNVADKVSKNRQNRGSAVGMSKLKEEDIPKIWDSFSRGMQAKTIAADLNVDPTTISYVLRKKTWIRETEKWESMNRKSWNSGIKMWTNI